MAIWTAVSIAAVFSIFLIAHVVGPPVNVNPEEANNTNSAEDEKKREVDLLNGLTYNKYLQEIISALEEDQAFKEKLLNANASDIKSGDIAQHLDLVNHGIRTRLDEMKRQEIERIKVLVQKRHQEKRLNIKDAERFVAHINADNQRTFEKEDLAKLIKQASKDLEDLDKKRRNEFKAYELNKEHERREKLRTMDSDHRAAEEKKQEELEKKHDNHPKVHHPGSRDQLEEVWEETDNLNKDEFDPKTFFHLHDINGDNYLDEQEIEALFKQELDKVYDPNAPEDDMVERYEEMNRMREHVMKEIDTDQDKMISFDEFMESTKGKDFNKDEGWDTIDDDKEFTEEELVEFERQVREQQKHNVAQEHAQPGEVNIPPVPQQHHQQQQDNVAHMQQQLQDPNQVFVVQDQQHRENQAGVHNNQAQVQDHGEPDRKVTAKLPAN